jgi:hypothetical protein
MSGKQKKGDSPEEKQGGARAKGVQQKPKGEKRRSLIKKKGLLQKYPKQKARISVFYPLNRFKPVAG